MLFKKISALLTAGLIALAPVTGQASQATFVLPIVGPLSMAEFVNLHLNPALAALASCHSGTAAPVNGPAGAPVQGQCWVDTTTAATFIHKITDGTGWTEVGRITTATNLYLPTIAGTSITGVSGTGGIAALTTSPVFVTPALGTPASGVLTNATGLPIIAGTTGTLTAARGGTGANNAATLNRFLKGDGTNYLMSTGAASGTGTCSAGSFVTALNSDAAPTCSASGGGSGDLLAANNLSDLGNLVTAFNNIKQAATTAVTGVVELATNLETTTGTDTTRATTPANVKAAIDAIPLASTTVSGLVELATTAETTTGTDATRAATSAGVSAAISAIASATTAATGVVELATSAETTTGTDTVRATTPAGVKAAIDAIPAQPAATTTVSGIVELATTAETTTGTDNVRATTPLGVKTAITDAAPPAATQLVAGIVELATSAESITGTDSTRATHPLGVKAAIDDRNIVGGNFTPDFNFVTNVTVAPSAFSGQYIRVGTSVNFSARVNINPITTGNTSIVNFSLPVNSTFTQVGQCAGTIVSIATDPAEAGIIYADINNANRCVVEFISRTTGSHTFYYNITYRIL